MVRDPELRFEHQLARDLGMTVGRLRHALTPDDFAHWAAFYAWEAQERERQNKAKPKRGGKRR